MRKLATFPVGILAVLPGVLALGVYWSGSAVAEPAWGGNCLACHGEDQGGTIVFIGYDGTVDPNESATGAPDRGPRPFYRLRRGESKLLQVDLTDLAAGDKDALELKRLRFPGVELGKQPSFGGDCGWPEWGEQAAYYTQPAVSYRWGSDPTAFTYELAAQAGSGLDYYDLVFALAGKRAGNGALFYAEEHVYVQVVLLPGDTNCDGHVGFGDINPFVVALTAPATYPAKYPACDIKSCDINGDGLVNGNDINPFVDLLTDGR
jgi:hypothetical protein